MSDFCSIDSSLGSSIDDANLDLTPLIDTVFMLLIFFIMATTFSKPVLEVALQEAHNTAVQDAGQQRITISITKEGSVVHDSTEIPVDSLDAFMAARPQDEQLTFNVDKGAPFGVFVQALDAAKKYGKANCAINTDPHEQPTS